MFPLWTAAVKQKVAWPTKFWTSSQNTMAICKMFYLLFVGLLACSENTLSRFRVCVCSIGNGFALDGSMVDWSQFSRFELDFNSI